MNSTSLSVHIKIILFSCGISLVTALIINFVMLNYIKQFSLDKSTAEFVGETRLMASSLNDVFEQLTNDSSLIIRTPPFQGLIRSIRNNNLDIIENSTTDLWKSRLSTIFTSVLDERAYYTQLRFIGLMNNGREIVRVNQTPDGITVTTEEALQEKSTEFYFRDTVGLKQDTVYYSTVTRNRDSGPNRSEPTIRAVQAVYDDQGEQFGIFVINLDYEKLFVDELSLLQPQYDSYIVDSYGNFGHFNIESNQSQFYLNSEQTEIPAEVLRILSSAGEEELFEEIISPNDIWGYTTSVALPLNDNSFQIKIAQFAPQEIIFSEATAIQSRMIVISGSLILATFLLTLAFSINFSRPILKIRDAVIAYGNGTKFSGTPTHLNDEIGELARAFESLTGRLDESIAKEREALNQLTTAIKSSVDGVITCDFQGKISRINPAAEKMFAYPKKELYGTSIYTLIPDLNLQGLDELTDHSNSLNTEETDLADYSIQQLKLVTKNGSIVPIELSLSALKTESHNNFWLVIRDVSLRVEQEAKIEKTLNELTLINTQLDDFTYIASHDLREPMRGVQIHAQSMIHNYSDVLDEKGVKKLTRMNELCDRMQLLVADLLNFSRLNRTKLDLDLIPVEQIIQTAINPLDSYFKEHNAVVTTQGPFPEIRCDSSRLSSVFMNLVVNGIKYNESENKTVKIGYIPNLIKDGINYKNVFYVRDNGIGIKPEFHEDIFKIFKRLNNEKVYGYGTGAGLTFVKKIIDQHHGKIWLESEPTKGSTFYFTVGEN